MFFSQLSDKTYLPVDVDRLTMQFQSSISWWLYASESYRTMANIYIKLNKQDRGHSNVSRLLLMLFLTGNMRIFYLTKIPVKKVTFQLL